MHQHHVKAAGRKAGQALQVMACGKNNSPLLDARDAGAGATVRGAGALAHFDKHQGAVGRAHDEVYLAAAASGRLEIALQQAQAACGQVLSGQRLGRVTAALGGNLLA